jgi:hypothetical protein
MVLLMTTKISHGGQRKGAGRKPAPSPVFIKKFRASEAEKNEFMSLLTGDARQDFVVVFEALRSFRSLTPRAGDGESTRA